jgi:hypothetical protein
MAFVLYLLGSVVLISGIAWIASALGVAPTFVTTCAVLLLFAATAVGATTLVKAKAAR